jgi:maltooligosyltrehalose trehalohydrolase
MHTAVAARRYPVGAEVIEGGVHFRVWAPARQRVVVIADGTRHALDRERDGYFSALLPDARPGTRYGFLLDDDETVFPDPASRRQPDGPHELSAVVDDSAYRWRDAGWRGLTGEQVIYEMHVGTFTAEGTWASAERELPYLAELGITAIEMLPVAEFPGRFGWGYDGVLLWAPTRLYGTPDDFRRFVDAAHGAGIGVILDVVYNHLGPDGNCLREFSPDYFTDRYKNEWGDPINFDGPRSGPVRDFMTSNAAYWIHEFHLDGLRVDATQSMFDASEEHVLALLSRRAREAAGERSILLIAENEPQDVRVVREYGFDALWNDDFHHSARVALTGRTDAYYADYRGRPQELVSLAKHGFLYQGQWYTWQEKHRGTDSRGLPRRAFVWYLQNHDQVANSTCGKRLSELASPPAVRAMTALLLLGPAQPMLFQGQEFGASSPFLYFADHKPELAKLVEKGRREFMSQFPAAATAEAQAQIPPPHEPGTFERSKLDRAERGEHEHVLRLHRELIALRRSDQVFRDSSSCGVDGAVLSDRAFLLRYSRDDGDDRLIVVNLGEALDLSPVPEPLLAPPSGRRWELLWSSEEPRYGGDGVTPAEVEGGWRFQASSTVVLRAKEKS